MMDWQLRPARDIDLSPGERLRSLARERGLGGLALNGAWRTMLRIYLGIFHRLEVEGREHLPVPPFVMIANHASHLDALVLAAALRGEAGRAAHALAAGEVFFGSSAGAAFSAYAINAMPIWRGRTRRGEIELLRTRLVEDRLVYILFPEGSRSRTGDLGQFQQGLARLVEGTFVPVIPCWIDGAFTCWPPQRRWPRPGKLRLRIGAPLDCSAWTTDAPGRTALTAACQTAVTQLAKATRPIRSDSHN